jgi:hypothetical protein
MHGDHDTTDGTDATGTFVEWRSRTAGLSGSVAVVHPLLTKRRAVDFCRLNSSLCCLA